MPQASTAVAKTGYAQIPGGPNLYYEIHGTAEMPQQAPLILLHGGFGSTGMLGDLVPSLARTRQVVAVDLQGHGRTADIDRPMTSEAFGDDVAALANQLHIQQVDLMGYSLGAATILQAAFRHPALVRKLVVVSTPCRRDGWYPEIRAQMDQMARASAAFAEQMKPSPIYQNYARIAPRPQDWPTVVAKLSALITKDYDWSSEVSALKSPAMLVFGDADSVRPEHIVEFFQLLGGGKKDGGWDGSGMPKSRLAIVPASTHYNVAASPILPSITNAFLDVEAKPA